MKKIFKWLFGWIFSQSGDDSPSESGDEQKVPDNWLGDAGVDAGANHVRAQPPVPCQDAAIVCTDTIRACAFVADGAGSASLSHFGSRETVLRLSHLAASLEDVHERMLDKPDIPQKDECQRHALRFLIHASETIKGLAAEKNQPFKEFRCTLLAVIVGAERIFWLKVGDGHIVREKLSKDLETVGPLGKGEYANVTRFVEEAPKKTDFSYGTFSVSEISGIALMTDGAAEKLVSVDGKNIGKRVSTLLAGVRRGNSNQDKLQDFLTNKEIWKPPGYTGDDKGMALLARLFLSQPDE